MIVKAHETGTTSYPRKSKSMYSQVSGVPPGISIVEGRVEGQTQFVQFLKVSILGEDSLRTNPFSPQCRNQSTITKKKTTGQDALAKDLKEGLVSPAALVKLNSQVSNTSLS